jgi:pyruvate kinase
MQKKTKIVATIGPASLHKPVLTQMIQSGVNVARLNFSHGTYAWHAHAIANIREVSEKLRTPVAILQDLSGPKLRLGEFKDKMLKKNQHVIFGMHGIPVGQPIWQWMKAGQTILIDDGNIELIATKIHDDGLEAKIIVPGKISSHKGVSLPGVQIKLPILSEKDLMDLEFGLKLGVDFVALSFVRTSSDIANLRQKIRKITKRQVQVIAKIETPEALKNIEKIVEASDGIMIGRGDMALNMNQAMVPLAQKNIVKMCLHHGKPAIVATQMLESMTHNPRPTRAEISDVANAVLDHTDAVMLSGESAFGDYPVKTVETMTSIISETENSPLDEYHHANSANHRADKQFVLAHTLIQMGIHSKVKAILTTDIKTAQGLSHFRPGFEIIFIAKDLSVANAAGLFWGVTSVHTKADPLAVAKNHGFLAKGDRFINATKGSQEASIDLIR